MCGSEGSRVNETIAGEAVATSVVGVHMMVVGADLAYTVTGNRLNTTLVVGAANEASKFDGDGASRVGLDVGEYFRAPGVLEGTSGFHALGLDATEAAGILPSAVGSDCIKFQEGAAVGTPVVGLIFRRGLLEDLNITGAGSRGTGSWGSISDGVRGRASGGRRIGCRCSCRGGGAGGGFLSGRGRS